MSRLIHFTLFTLAAGFADRSFGAVIDFEGFAGAGGLVNVSLGNPYFEEGYTITATNDQSAVFDSAASSDMPGNSTDWFGFAETNFPTLTLTSGTLPFALQSALIGPSTIGGGNVAIMITGNLVGGGTVSQTFNGLVSATTVTLNFNNLVSVDFVASDDAGIDELVVQTVPEPSALLLSLSISALLGCFLRR